MFRLCLSPVFAVPPEKQDLGLYFFPAKTGRDRVNRAAIGRTAGEEGLHIRSHLNELRTFSDMTESHWAYWYAMEAANGHDYTKSGGSENWNRTYR